MYRVWTNINHTINFVRRRTVNKIKTTYIGDHVDTYHFMNIIFKNKGQRALNIHISCVIFEVIESLNLL